MTRASDLRTPPTGRGSDAVTPSDVHATLRRHVLTDGFDLVLDVRASRGSRLVDARDGQSYLDMFTFFASNALGMNHPRLADDTEFLDALTRAAVNKPSNSDIYTTEYATFVETFERVLGDPALPHYFFIDGGALAVENALKVAFDWKSRLNEQAGRSRELGKQVMHLRHAFHGRSGYTMSLTNTDPVKTDRFPTFDWPRVDSPAVGEYATDAELTAAEDAALSQARAYFEDRRHDIAAFIAEPVQGEGGDRHLRPRFFAGIAALCREFDALFIVDEVQTGCGITGTTWAYQQLGITPDIVVFGKKAQVCGIMAGRRVDDIAENVFTVSSRINSTWGANAADMVRATEIYRVIADENLVDTAAVRGHYLQRGLADLASRHDTVSNVRGRGLLSAFDLTSAQERNEFLGRLHRDHHVIMLGCGDRAVRFRPALTVTEAELDEALAAMDAALASR